MGRWPWKQRCSFTGRSLQVRDAFKFVAPSQVFGAGKVFASTLYGRMLRCLDSPPALQVARCWSTCVKDVWGQLARQPSHQCSLRENIPAQWVGYYQSRQRSAIAQIAANDLRIQQGDSQKLGLQRATVIPTIVPEKLSFWSGG